MPIEVADLERFRDEIVVAMQLMLAASEARLDGKLSDALATSEQRLDARIGASAAETRRHMDVVAEDLRAKIALVAEGTVTLTERLARDLRDGFEIVDRRLLRLEARLLSTPERG